MCYVYVVGDGISGFKTLSMKCGGMYFTLSQRIDSRDR